MKIWAVEKDGETVVRITNGDDLSAEGIDPGDRNHEIPRRIMDIEYWDWDTLQIKTKQEDPEPNLLLRIDARRDELYKKSLNLSPARMIEYNNKLFEAYSDVGPWPYMQMLAQHKGTDVETERLAVILARQDDELWRADMIGMVGALKKAIREEPDYDQKVAIFNAAVWPELGEVE